MTRRFNEVYNSHIIKAQTGWKRKSKRKKEVVIMMNEELYEALELEFEKNHMDEDVEDVLLELSEIIADAGIMDKEVIRKESYGKTAVEACGLCSEEDGETDVLLLWVRVGRKTFEVHDYFL